MTRLSWGRLEVEGQGTAFKDAKLYPGGSRAWDWRETGTDHAPGIQPADVEELLDHGATIVVLSQGMLGRLRVHPETLRMLRDRGVTAHVLRTEAAVRLYNELTATGPVAGLFHSTC
ncbi:MAG TPA: Mth938-like domain-containing protein [Gemmatimonadales bacterium]|nr:Mth938-like domain-containing protein [Gemmatimonadales bacterium]